MNEINPEIIMDAVENVLQSEENLNAMKGFDVQLGVARFERGGTNGNPIINVQDARFSKRAIVSINNLARALAVSIAKNNVEKANDGEKTNAEKIYRNIQKGDQKRQISAQKRKALEYQALAGVPTDPQSSLLDIPFFEDVLDTDVVFAAYLNNKVLYLDTEQPRKKTSRLYVYYTRNNIVGHFDCIVNIKGMLGMGYFCHHCFKGFNTYKEHSCEVTCQSSHSTSCKKTNPFTCRKCQTVYHSQECFQRHQQG